MGQKSKTHQELDRAIGEWKQDLLDECEEIVVEDMIQLARHLKKTRTELAELHEEAKRTRKESKEAYEEMSEAVVFLDKRNKQYQESKAFTMFFVSLFSSAFGSFITFLLLSFFW